MCLPLIHYLSPGCCFIRRRRLLWQCLCCTMRPPCCAMRFLLLRNMRGVCAIKCAGLRNAQGRPKAPSL